ncbi:MAG: 2-phospho-L-lactate guanylyltransferase [Gammaproteobacteria bacterium]|nr:2-phospho-L-lactate guanylyltransferase [Gammaproteobacteria bacterium]
MAGAWALIPVKPFALAKTRLEGVLSRDECAQLAAHMLQDVLRALCATPLIGGITLLGNEPQLAALTAGSGAQLLPEPEGMDYRLALGEAAATLATEGVRQLLVLPADLPTLTASDLRRLIEGHSGGLSLCPAARDGGSNALLLSPPTAIPFLYGPDSARRHLEAAGARGLAARHIELPGFARDIDTPDDVYWLLEQRIACATLAWLKSSGIRDRLRRTQKDPDS